MSKKPALSPPVFSEYTSFARLLTSTPNTGPQIHPDRRSLVSSSPSAVIAETKRGPQHVPPQPHSNIPWLSALHTPRQFPPQNPNTPWLSSSQVPFSAYSPVFPIPLVHPVCPIPLSISRLNQQPLGPPSPSTVAPLSSSPKPRVLPHVLAANLATANVHPDRIALVRASPPKFSSSETPKSYSPKLTKRKPTLLGPERHLPDSLERPNKIREKWASMQTSDPQQPHKRKFVVVKRARSDSSNGACSSNEGLELSSNHKSRQLDSEVENNRSGVKRQIEVIEISSDSDISPRIGSISIENTGSSPSSKARTFAPPKKRNSPSDILLREDDPLEQPKFALAKAAIQPTFCGLSDISEKFESTIGWKLKEEGEIVASAYGSSTVNTATTTSHTTAVTIRIGSSGGTRTTTAVGAGGARPSDSRSSNSRSSSSTNRSSGSCASDGSRCKSGRSSGSSSRTSAKASVATATHAAETATTTSTAKTAPITSARSGLIASVTRKRSSSDATTPAKTARSSGGSSKKRRGRKGSSKENWSQSSSSSSRSSRSRRSSSSSSIGSDSSSSSSIGNDSSSNSRSGSSSSIGSDNNSSNAATVIPQTFQYYSDDEKDAALDVLRKQVRSSITRVATPKTVLDLTNEEVAREKNKQAEAQLRQQLLAAIPEPKKTFTPLEIDTIMTKHGLRRDMSILVLGDGNMSFSVSLARLLSSMSGVLFVTTLDSEAELRRKYESADKNFEFLRSLSWVTVKPDTDAKKLKHDSFGGRLFDLVIWNFPHTGANDENSNVQLMRRFFACVRDLLLPQGQVHLRVCNRQEITWAIDRLAFEYSFHFLELSPFDITEFPGYERRKIDDDIGWNLNWPTTMRFMLKADFRPLGYTQLSVAWLSWRRSGSTEGLARVFPDPSRPLVYWPVIGGRDPEASFVNFAEAAVIVRILSLVTPNNALSVAVVSPHAAQVKAMLVAWKDHACSQLRPPEMRHLIQFSQLDELQEEVDLVLFSAVSIPPTSPLRCPSPCTESTPVLMTEDSVPTPSTAQHGSSALPSASCSFGSDSLSPSRSSGSNSLSPASFCISPSPFEGTLQLEVSTDKFNPIAIPSVATPAISTTTSTTCSVTTAATLASNSLTSSSTSPLVKAHFSLGASNQLSSISPDASLQPTCASTAALSSSHVRRLTIRARSGLVVVGNPDVMKIDAEWAKWVQWMQENGLVGKTSDGKRTLQSTARALTILQTPTSVNKPVSMERSPSSSPSSETSVNKPVSMERSPSSPPSSETVPTLAHPISVSPLMDSPCSRQHEDDEALLSVSSCSASSFSCSLSSSSSVHVPLLPPSFPVSSVPPMTFLSKRIMTPVVARLLSRSHRAATSTTTPTSLVTPTQLNSISPNYSSQDTPTTLSHLNSECISISGPPPSPTSPLTASRDLIDLTTCSRQPFLEASVVDSHALSLLKEKLLGDMASTLTALQERELSRGRNSVSI